MGDLLVLVEVVVLPSLHIVLLLVTEVVALPLVLLLVTEVVLSSLPIVVLLLVSLAERRDGGDLIFLGPSKSIEKLTASVGLV